MISFEISKFVGLFPYNPRVFLLNDFSKCCGLSGYNPLITYALVVAKTLVASYRKSPQLPTKLEW